MGIFSGCATTSGPEAGQPCIFPYTAVDKTCAGPTCCNFDDDSKGPWCSTKVDKNGVHITGEYGYCSAPCIGKHIKLPIVTKIFQYFHFQMSFSFIFNQKLHGVKSTYSPKMKTILKCHVLRSTGMYQLYTFLLYS